MSKFVPGRPILSGSQPAENGMEIKIREENGKWFVDKFVNGTIDELYLCTSPESASLVVKCLCARTDPPRNYNELSTE